MAEYSIPLSSLSEHNPEFAKESASRRISTPYRSPCCAREFYRHLLFRCRQTDSLRQSYGENSLKPHGQRTYPRGPSTRAVPQAGLTLAQEDRRRDCRNHLTETLPPPVGGLNLFVARVLKSHASQLSNLSGVVPAPRQCSLMKSISEAFIKNHFPYQHLWLRVLGTNERHPLTMSSFAIDSGEKKPYTPERFRRRGGFEKISSWRLRLSRSTLRQSE